MLTQSSLTKQLSVALGGNHDSLIPHLALALADGIMPLQRNLNKYMRQPSSAEFEQATADLESKIDEIEETFAGQLNQGEFYELLRKSRESVAENNGDEREAMLRKIAAEHNSKPVERE